MDYKQEYEAMVQRCKELHEAGNALTKQQMEIVCPQLVESEDERIRNLIYCLIRDRSDNGKLLEANGCSVEKALAWLEKQR